MPVGPLGLDLSAAAPHAGDDALSDPSQDVAVTIHAGRQVRLLEPGPQALQEQADAVATRLAQLRQARAVAREEQERLQAHRRAALDLEGRVPRYWDRDLKRILEGIAAGLWGLTVGAIHSAGWDSSPRDAAALHLLISPLIAWPAGNALYTFGLTRYLRAQARQHEAQARTAAEREALAARVDSLSLDIAAGERRQERLGVQLALDEVIPETGPRGTVMDYLGLPE